MIRSLIVLAACSATLLISAAGHLDPLDEAIAGAHRDAENVARDVYRHPKETLSFFGMTPDMNVLEVLPGGGWYTEILAPYLRDNGSLSIAGFGADHPSKYLRKAHNRLIEKFDAQPEIYGAVTRGVFKRESFLEDFADGSFDMVVTFRNSHHWVRRGEAEEIYQTIHRRLKPGGVLGVVQHRAEPGADPKTTANSGYVPEGYMIGLLEGMGFELVDKAEINANPKDTKDYEEGVWTLPPSYRLKDKDRARYTAIGESDRMTMKFIKL